MHNFLTGCSIVMKRNEVCANCGPSESISPDPSAILLLGPGSGIVSLVEVNQAIL